MSVTDGTDCSWDLMRTNETGLTKVATTPNLAAAVQKLIATEAITTPVLTFKLYAETKAERDNEILDHLEYSGRHGVYVIRRS